MNPLSTRPEHSLFPWPPNCTGHRLCHTILAIPRSEYVQFSRHNLCVGDWDAKKAKVAAEHLRKSYGGRKLVLLGKKVCDAFGVEYEPLRTEEIWYEDTQRAVTYVVFSHPSGRSRWWNEPGSYEKARALMQREFPHIEFGSALEGR